MQQPTEYEDTKVYRLPPIKDGQVDDLLQALQKTGIDINRRRKTCGVGRSQCFGVVRRGPYGIGEVNNNEKHPELYRLLRKLGDEIVPFGYDAIQVNHNYQTLPHRDKNNYGHSVIVSLGNYKGGNLVINNESHSTHLHPLVFNGSLLEHYNTEIEGDKYSIVFFRNRPSKRQA